MEKLNEFIEFSHPILDDFKSNFKYLKFEAENAYKNDLFIEWINKQLYENGWSAIGFRYEGVSFVNEILVQLLPSLHSLFKKYDDDLYSLAFSNFEANTIIKPHFDRLHPHNIIRCHLGITVPDGDCKLKVNGHERKWSEGEFLIFDDAFEHEAWNRTETNRIVLLIDLFKDRVIK